MNWRGPRPLNLDPRAACEHIEEAQARTDGFGPFKVCRLATADCFNSKSEAVPQPYIPTDADLAVTLAAELHTHRQNVEYVAALALEHLASGDMDAAMMCLRILVGGRASRHASH